MLAKPDGDANTILAAGVARSVAHQDAALAHLADERFALVAEIKKHKIRAAGPEANSPCRKFRFKFSTTLNRLSDVIANERLIGESIRQASQRNCIQIVGGTAAPID